MESDADRMTADLARRLLVAAGRVEKSVYSEPMSMEEAVFRLDWSDALVTLAETLIRHPEP